MMILRSTFIGDAKSCPKRAFYRYEKGLYVKTDKVNPDLFFGTVIDQLVETYHLEGFEVAEDQLNSIRDWPDHPKKTYQTAKMLLVAYAKNKIPMTYVKPQQSFSFDLGEHVWIGRYDGVGEKNGKLWLIEHKTTKPLFLVTKPNDQFISYFIAGRIHYGPDLEGMVINSFDVETKDVKRIFIHYTDEEVDAWKEETKIWADNYERYREMDCFPKNPSSCYQYGRNCEFRDLCETSPKMARILESSLYSVNDKLKNMAW